MAAIPVTTALRRKDRLWPTVTFSAAAHAALIVWVLLRVPAPAIDLDQKPIVAKLVRLGPKKPPEYLPRKEAPPPPAPAEAAPTPVAAPAPAAPAAPIAAIAKADPKPAPPKAQSPNPGKATSNSLASVLSKVRASAAKEEPQYGDPDGDPLGDSEEGTEGDRYLALVDREIRANYDVPSTISDRERLYLKATVVIYIEPDGRIGRWQFQAPSGNPAFDAALERTLRKTRVPPPPDGAREAYRRNGLQVIFQIG
jgi:colicin import membrane protein/protein TonB